MTRTTTALAALALAATLGLSACGGDSQAKDAEPKADATTSATPTESTTPTPAPAPSETPEPDVDADGVLDVDDAFPADPEEWTDADGNGTGDNADARAQRKAEAAAKRKAELQGKIDKATGPSERQWAQIVKDPDAHKGEVYVVYAQIWQFDAATGTDHFNADAAPTNTMSYGYFEGDSGWFGGGTKQLAPYVEDDVVVMTVQVKGSESYDTQAGGNTTVPSFTVLKIARV